MLSKSITFLKRVLYTSGKDGQKARSGQLDTVSLANSVNPTSSAYIKKIMGVGGALDIITKEFKGVIG